MHSSIETRLRRLERASADRDPARQMRATLLHALPGEDVTDRVAGSGHRLGWPLLIVRSAKPVECIA